MKSSRWPRFLLLVGVPLCLSLATAEAHDSGVRYDVTDLGPGREAVAINDSGHVLVWDVVTCESVLVQTWRRCGFRDVARTGVPFLPYDINNHWVAVGATADNSTAQVWRPGRGISPLPDPYGAWCYPMAINERGTVVGNGDGGGPWVSVLLWTKHGSVSVLDSLGPFRTWVYGKCLNARGWVVGVYDLTDPTVSPSCSHAFLWREEVGAMEDLGTVAGGSNSWATGVNDAGQILVWGDGADGATHWGLCVPHGRRSLTIADLGSPAGSAWSRPWAINNAGLAVGASDLGACLWQQGSSFAYLHELLAPGSEFLSRWLGTVAIDVNDRGEMVGWGQDEDGVVHAFLAAPTRCHTDR